MNSVLVSHFVSTGVMNAKAIANESLIFLIGVAFGILVNLHLHKNTKQMNELKQKINEKIKNILQRGIKQINHPLLKDGLLLWR